MNVKFEKWCEDNQLARDGQFTCDEANVAEAAWQAAIKSLEVTPELVAIGIEATSHNSFATTSDIGDALRAVLSALKEQANG